MARVTWRAAGYAANLARGRNNWPNDCKSKTPVPEGVPRKSASGLPESVPRKSASGLPEGVPRKSASGLPEVCRKCTKFESQRLLPTREEKYYSHTVG